MSKSVTSSPPSAPFSTHAGTKHVNESASPPLSAARVFVGGGELGALCRAKDWSKTALGPVEQWPQSLRTAVSVVLGSSFPMVVLWGPELIQIYNDDYRLLMGVKHPSGLGQGNRECWPEAWHINEAIYPRVFAGETIHFKEQVYPLAPYGKVEDFHLTLCYGPVRDETGNVGGVFVTVFDVSQQVTAERTRDRALAELKTERERLYDVFMQAPAIIAVLEGPEHRFTVANDRYRELVGGRDVVGKPVGEALPEVVEQGFLQLLENVRETGKPHLASEALVRLDRRGDGVLEDLYLDFIYQPLKNAVGQVFGVLAHAVDVTQQVVARKRIEVLASERAAVLGQIADGVVTIDAAGAISFINDVAKGFHPALDTGVPVTRELVSVRKADGSAFSPGELPLERALRGEKVDNAEWMLLRGERTLRIQGSARPVHGDAGTLLGAVLTFRDITEQQRLQQQVELERNRLQHVFAQAPAAIMVMRASDQVIEAANPRYTALTGNRKLIGLRVRDAFPDLEGQGLFELYDQVIASGEPYVGQEVPVRVERFGRTDEAYFNFVYQPLLDDSGRTFSVMTHAVEVTDMVRARQDAERRAAELVRLTRALELSNRELDQFAYVASHDLKAPLRAIGNLSEWIEEDAGPQLSATARDQMAMLRGRVHRMEALIDGILAYSRAGRVHEAAVRVDTAALLREVTEMLSPPAHVRLEVQADFPTLTAERVPLQQVFLNLISNALKFSGAARSDPHVQVRWRDEGAAFAFSVADNGPGIEQQYHDRVWGIFQTLEARDKIEGAGIGLSVVQKLVEARGGKVWLESEPGKGATFHFTWPKEPPVERPA